MYLFTTTRHGISARELQRQLDVTLKTAWRIGHEIRKYMRSLSADDDLSGDIEIDETMIGGKRSGKRGRAAEGKTTVFGMLEREGNIVTHIIPNVKRRTLAPLIERHARKGSSIYTDELKSYGHLSRVGYQHQTVNHSAKEWVRDTCHVNSLEGFWSLLKRSILGTHVWVSEKHLDKYLGEFRYRYNMRKSGAFMFQRLLLSF
jgi:transposase